MLQGPIAHLARIGSLAAREQHELRTAFLFKPDGQHAAGIPAGRAGDVRGGAGNKEVLVQHGLSASVLAQFGESLDEFDAAMALGGTGRTLHTAATRELDALTKEAHAIVRAMDARIRLRYPGRPAGAGAVGQRADAAGGPGTGRRRTTL